LRLRFAFVLVASFCSPAVHAQASSEASRQLLDAARTGNVGGLVAAIARGADLEAKAGDRDGSTALHLAVRSKSVEAVELLLQRGAKADNRSGDGWTALMQAAFSGNANMVQALVAAGADVQAREPRHGNTPLIVAAIADRNVEAVAELLASGADVELAAFDGRTPVLAAARNGATGMLQLLLDEGASRDPSRLHAQVGDQNRVVTVFRVRCGTSDQLWSPGLYVDLPG
jgi:ankyrin repeat protein